MLYVIERKTQKLMVGSETQLIQVAKAQVEVCQLISKLLPGEEFRI